MALEIDAAALLIYRAAWAKDMGAARVTREAAMAKLFATEAAQRVIDTAVQIHGGDGVRSGPSRRNSLSGNPRATHLRRRVRRSENRYCAIRPFRIGALRWARANRQPQPGPSAHIDTFTRDNLPPFDQWPDLLARSAGISISGVPQRSR